MRLLLMCCFSLIMVSAEYRIAFVKQIVYPDLYCLSGDVSTSDLIFSSLKRSGPVGLFSRYNADFYVVSLGTDATCQLWQENGTFCSNDPRKYIKFISKEILSEDSLLRKIMVDSCQVDWGQYDIVICVDTAIPSKITKEFPQTLWVYYIGEGLKLAGKPIGQKSYVKSWSILIDGYDYFLSQDFHKDPNLPDHVIEFPYQLQYYPCYHELFQVSPSDIRPGIFLECHTAHYLRQNTQERIKLNEVCPIIGEASGTNNTMTLKQLIQGLMSAKYFVVCIPVNSQVRNYLRGNCIVEAIAAGSLVIARPSNLSNFDVLTPKTIVNSFVDVCERIVYFETHPEAYEREVEAQRGKIYDLCFKRPMDDLFKRCAMKKQTLAS